MVLSRLGAFDLAPQSFCIRDGHRFNALVGRAGTMERTYFASIWRPTRTDKRRL
jgi:hypothetical protein